MDILLIYIQKLNSMTWLIKMATNQDFDLIIKNMKFAKKEYKTNKRNGLSRLNLANKYLIELVEEVTDEVLKH